MFNEEKQRSGCGEKSSENARWNVYHGARSQSRKKKGYEDTGMKSLKRESMLATPLRIEKPPKQSETEIKKNKDYRNKYNISLFF